MHHRAGDNSLPCMRFSTCVGETLVWFLALRYNHLLAATAASIARRGVNARAGMFW